jgi:hypothetical protein
MTQDMQIGTTIHRDREGKKHAKRVKSKNNMALRRQAFSYHDIPGINFSVQYILID